MHLQLVAAAFALCDQHRVIEITGRFAVDGDYGQAAKITPSCNLLLVQMSHGARLGQYVFRKSPRQLVLADHHFHVHAEVVRRAQHLDHAAHRLPRRRGPTGNLHIHHQAFEAFVNGRRRSFLAQHAMLSSLARRRYLLPGRNENVLRHTLVERNNSVSRRPVTSRVMKDAHHCGVAPFQNAHNPAHPASIRLGRLHFHQHLVALHSAVDFVRRNKNVFLY